MVDELSDIVCSSGTFYSSGLLTESQIQNALGHLRLREKVFMGEEGGSYFELNSGGIEAELLSDRVIINASFHSNDEIYSKLRELYPKRKKSKMAGPFAGAFLVTGLSAAGSIYGMLTNPKFKAGVEDILDEIAQRSLTGDLAYMLIPILTLSLIFYVSLHVFGYRNTDKPVSFKE